MLSAAVKDALNPLIHAGEAHLLGWPSDHGGVSVSETRCGDLHPAPPLQLTSGVHGTPY